MATGEFIGREIICVPKKERYRPKGSYMVTLKVVCFFIECGTHTELHLEVFFDLEFVSPSFPLCLLPV